MRPFALFAYGFRPFFLAAIGYGLVAIVAWTAIRATGGAPLPNLPPQLWHGHEMLFGFVSAAIAGFLLTAVPSWTGARGFAGWPLAALTLLWLSGRVAFAFATALPPGITALLELSFLPALAFLVAIPLLRSRNRNTPLLGVLAALWLVDATFMCALALGEISLASATLRVALDIVLVLITVIGGRIIPSFTASALRRRGVDAPVRSNAWLDGVTIATMILLVAVDVIAPTHRAAAGLAAIAALAHVVRLSGWRGMHSLNEPLVWVLHLAYLWMPVGLALKAVYLLTGADFAAGWLHALSIGVASMMIVAVITRASLGHTGRPLIASKVVAVAYVALFVAALARVLATATIDFYESTLTVAASLWIVAFAILVITYGPVLLKRRVDGREG